MPLPLPLRTTVQLSTMISVLYPNRGLYPCPCVPTEETATFGNYITCSFIFMLQRLRFLGRVPALKPANWCWLGLSPGPPENKPCKFPGLAGSPMLCP